MSRMIFQSLFNWKMNQKLNLQFKKFSYTKHVWISSVFPEKTRKIKKFTYFEHGQTQEVHHFIIFRQKNEIYQNCNCLEYLKKIQNLPHFFIFS